MKKRKLFLIIFSLLIMFSSVLTSAKIAFADVNDKLYLGGFPAGFSVYTRGAHISGFSLVATKEGNVSPCKDCGMQIGDEILFINNIETNNAKDIEKSLEDESEKVLTVERNNELLYFKLKPAKDLSGKYKLGIFVREGINGIGTITFIKGKEFASLGHPVINESGGIVKISGGKIYNCSITNVIKGERGKAGELQGVFLREFDIGVINKNIETGVYGTIKKINYSNLVEVKSGEAVPGEAKVITTIDGINPKEYKITIVKAENKGKETKNLVLKITDENLLNRAGGIVQGMSGSPIIQNGKLVGAVTHVFINDPSRGFGISIEQMLK